MTGSRHMNGRVYDPQLGRFLSVDPVFAHPTNAQSLNPYSYVLNSPLSLTDPTGLADDDKVVTGAAANQSDAAAGERIAHKKGGDTGEDNTGNSNKGDARSKFFAKANGKFSQPGVAADKDGNKHVATRNLASGNANWQKTSSSEIGELAERASARPMLNLENLDLGTLMADRDSPTAGVVTDSPTPATLHLLPGGPAEHKGKTYKNSKGETQCVEL